MKEVKAKSGVTYTSEPDNSSFIYEQALKQIKDIHNHMESGSLTYYVGHMRVKKVLSSIELEEPCPHRNVSVLGLCLDCKVTIERRHYRSIPGVGDYPKEGLEKSEHRTYEFFRLTPKGTIYPERRKGKGVWKG